MRTIGPILALVALLGPACDKRSEPVRPGEQITQIDEESLAQGEDDPLGGDEGGEPIDTTTQVEGGLSPAQVQAVIDEQFRPVRECFDAALARAHVQNVTGPIVVRWVVVKDGTVEEAAVAESSFDDEAAGECIAAAVSAWTCPKPRQGKPARVRYAFLLRSY